jgi:hydrogenase nickel incorporation protein HypA/HybF
MHELSICQQIMAQVGEIALQNQATAIESITLQIGPLSGVEAVLLKQAFPFATAQSIAENAELIIDELPIVIQCNQCGSKTNATANKLVCGECGDYHTQLISGDEMLLVSVELTRDNPIKEELTTEASSVESRYV